MADNEPGFGMRPASHRIERFCDACGQVDSDPHHVAFQDDGTTTDRHHDCCAAAGCPENVCGTIVADAGNKTGAAMVKHLTGGGAKNLNYTAKEN